MEKGNFRILRYRPNDVLDYIAMKREVTHEDLQKYFNFTELDTVSVIFVLYTSGFISHSMTPLNEDGRSFAIYKLTPLGREKKKEDLGITSYQVGPDHELSPLALEFLSTCIDRSMKLSDGLSDSEIAQRSQEVAQEAFTAEQLKKLDDEFGRIGGQ